MSMVNRKLSDAGRKALSTDWILRGEKKRAAET